MPSAAPLRVTVAGGAVAALETLLALRDLAGDRVRVTLVAPDPAFAYRPLSVGEPFALAHATSYPLDELATELGAELVRGAVAEVDPHGHRVRLADGTEVAHDQLVVAVGARQAPAYEPAITYPGPGGREALAGLLADLEGGYARRVAFVMPEGPSWPFPLYELALMTAREVWALGMDRAELTLVTPERAPLEPFGPEASGAVSALLADARIAFAGSARPEVRRGAVVVRPGEPPLAVDRVVSLPALSGPGIPGLPADAAGFLPVDALGRVHGAEDVFAVGDCAAYPIKQGGLATQQADAAATAIAADAGAPVEPVPFRPVLRGLLMTGGEPAYLRHATEGGGEVAGRALWWPPSKIAGRYLAPYLFGRDEAELLGMPFDPPRLAVAQHLPPPRVAGTAGGIEILATDPAAGNPGSGSGGWPHHGA